MGLRSEEEYPRTELREPSSSLPEYGPYRSGPPPAGVDTRGDDPFLGVADQYSANEAIDGEAIQERLAADVNPEPRRRVGGTVEFSSYEIGSGTGPGPMNVRTARWERQEGDPGDLVYPDTPADVPEPRAVGDVEDQWLRLSTEAADSSEVIVGTGGSVSRIPSTIPREDFSAEAAFRNEHSEEINLALQRPQYEEFIRQGQEAIQQDPNAIEPQTGERWIAVIAAAQGRVNDIDALDQDVLDYAAGVQYQIDQSQVPTAVRYGNPPGLSVIDAEAAAMSPYSDGGFRITDRELSQIRAGQYTAVVDSVALGLNVYAVPRLAVGATSGVRNLIVTRRNLTQPIRRSPGNVAEELAEEQAFQLAYVPGGGNPVLNPLNVVEGAGIGAEAGLQSVAGVPGRRYRTGLAFDDNPLPVTAQPRLTPVTYSGAPYGLITPGDPTPTRFTPYGTAFRSGGAVVDPTTPVPPSLDRLWTVQRPDVVYDVDISPSTTYGQGYSFSYGTAVPRPSGLVVPQLRTIAPVQEPRAAPRLQRIPAFQVQQQTRSATFPDPAVVQLPRPASISAPQMFQAPQPVLIPAAVPVAPTQTQTQIRAPQIPEPTVVQLPASAPQIVQAQQPVPAPAFVEAPQTQTQLQAQTAPQEQWVVLPSGLTVPAASVAPAPAPGTQPAPALAAQPATAPALGTSTALQPAPALSPALSPALATQPVPAASPALSLAKTPATVPPTIRRPAPPRLRPTATTRTPTRARVNLDGPNLPGSSLLSPAAQGPGYPAKAEFITFQVNQADFRTGQVYAFPISNDHVQSLRVTERTNRDTRGRKVDAGSVSVEVGPRGRARIAGENPKPDTTPSKPSRSSEPGRSPFVGGGGGRRRRRRNKDDWRNDEEAYGAGGAPVVRIVAKY